MPSFLGRGKGKIRHKTKNFGIFLNFLAINFKIILFALLLEINFTTLKASCSCLTVMMFRLSNSIFGFSASNGPEIDVYRESRVDCIRKTLNEASFLRQSHSFSEHKFGN